MNNPQPGVWLRREAATADEHRSRRDPWYHVQGMPRSVQVISDPQNHMTRDVVVKRPSHEISSILISWSVALQNAGLIPRDMRDMESSIHQIVNAAIGSGKPKEES